MIQRKDEIPGIEKVKIARINEEIKNEEEKTTKMDNEINKELKIKHQTYKGLVIKDDDSIRSTYDESLGKVRAGIFIKEKYSNLIFDKVRIENKLISKNNEISEELQKLEKQINEYCRKLTDKLSSETIKNDLVNVSTPSASFSEAKSKIEDNIKKCRDQYKLFKKKAVD